MKKILKNLIYLIIYYIEKLEYKKLGIEDNEFKFVDVINVEGINVETDYGYVPVSEINLTIPYDVYELVLDNGMELQCADDHIVFNENHILYPVAELTTDDYVLTRNGKSKVKSIKKITKFSVSMLDFSIETNEKSYYTNDILSHNTVTTSIFMLHTILFNNSKNVMMIANKGDTVKEIIKKIKDIYILLPYHMKQGVINWAERKIALENGSVIHTQLRSKEPAIGFAIDVLYMDEFAKIPDNIIRPYYTSAVPTVSSMENSKIIITSTPDGYNLFWELLISSEKDRFDPLWNGYASMRVYWWQVEGRRDTKLFFDELRTKKFGFTESSVLKYLKDEYDYKIKKKEESGDTFYNIKFIQDVENTKIQEIKAIRYNGVPLMEFCRVTNWEEQQTKLLENPSAFKQEYDLHFLAEDKLLFNSVDIESIREKVMDFENFKIPAWETKLNIPYNNLKFISGCTELFDVNEISKYKILISVDLADGLGGDYSTINIFRMLPKSINEVEKHRHLFTSKYDFFKLEQIGIWRSNIYSVDEVAHILYMITHELFNPENVKTVLEMNRGYGQIILSKLPHVFNGRNNYSSSVFVRYKHRESDKTVKIGLNVSRSMVKGSTGKNVLIKEYQNAIKNYKMILHEEMSIREISTFTKRESTGGNITYKAESGHDDCIMTLINLSSIYDHVEYKNLIDSYIQFDLTDEYRKIIFDFVENIDDGSVANLNSFGSTFSKIYKKDTNLNDNEKFMDIYRKNTGTNIKNLGNWWGNQ